LWKDEIKEGKGVTNPIMLHYEMKKKVTVIEDIQNECFGRECERKVTQRNHNTLYTSRV